MGCRDSDEIGIQTQLLRGSTQCHAEHGTEIIKVIHTIERRTGAPPVKSHNKHTSTDHLPVNKKRRRAEIHPLISRWLFAKLWKTRHRDTRINIDSMRSSCYLTSWPMHNTVLTLTVQEGRICCWKHPMWSLKRTHAAITACMCDVYWHFLNKSVSLNSMVSGCSRVSNKRSSLRSTEWIRLADYAAWWSLVYSHSQ